MVSIENHTQSFLIKIWLEEKPDDDREGTWRGEITSVNDNERRYLLEADDILDHIRPYLEDWGVNF